MGEKNALDELETSVKIRPHPIPQCEKSLFDCSVNTVSPDDDGSGQEEGLHHHRHRVEGHDDADRVRLNHSLKKRGENRLEDAE